MTATMLKQQQLRNRSSSQSSSSLRHLVGISPAAFLLLRGVSAINTKYVGNNNNPSSVFPLSRCEGDCDVNTDCSGGLICHQRHANEAVPGCDGGEQDSSETDYCIQDPSAAAASAADALTLSSFITTTGPTPIPAPTPPAPTPLPTSPPTNNPNGLKEYNEVSKFKSAPFDECEGDCNSNSDCYGDLVCYQREAPGDPLPGCNGIPESRSDFCIRPEFSPKPTRRPTPQPTPAPTFMPIAGGEPAARLKMYWQRGYMWQESSREEWYCLQCRDTCTIGKKLEIDDCSRSLRQQFVRVTGDLSIRPAMSGDLCAEHQGIADLIEGEATLRLQYCNNSTRQQFKIVGTPWQTDGKFEIQPISLRSNNNPTCLTQPHHPRPFEDIFPQRCDRARSHTTSFWTVY